VEAVYLVHGTFVGPDALGILAELARVFPSAGKAVRRVIKRIVDKVAGEAGNYTPGFARCFESSMCREGESPIPVHLFHWSSENHHLGRADGAVRLIDELVSRRFTPGKRVLLFGHSHAGNVFALMTNLLAGNREATERFFKAAEIYYRWPVVGVVDIPVWNRVRDLLRADPLPLADVDLDIVTFGTPIRYGWDSTGYAKLLHFINHRPAEGVPEYRAPFPPKVDDIFSAEGGDYVQQLGIAGTNVMPSLFAWREWMADNRLNQLLQGESPEVGGLERFQAGAIVPDDGTSLLVDYGLPQGGIGEHLAGHAVYTHRNWLLFHAEEVARRLYDAESKAA
ncbi:MAG TPA: hypothetical protein VE890_02115, partial [Thermoguttaceae bacterium]|nr:hypothetical protein [Thermoguttaceae bacterium]